MERPRVFLLRRSYDDSGVSGLGDIAWGCQFPDGVCVVRWRGDGVKQTSVWESIDDVRMIHGHGGHTRVIWVSKIGPSC